MMRVKGIDRFFPDPAVKIHIYCSTCCVPQFFINRASDKGCFMIVERFFVKKKTKKKKLRCDLSLEQR